MDQYQQFIYKRTYSRWLEKENRREEWDETVDRYKAFFEKRLPDSPNLKADFYEAIEAIRRLEVMPSMRCLWSAGEPLERENIAGYNCAYTVIDSPKALAEVLYILMNGTGVGFSVERQYVSKLPEVPRFVGTMENPLIFADSKLGWAKGYYDFLLILFSGITPTYALSEIRPKGSRLKTFGGRASGPEPLKQLLDFTIKIFHQAAGRKLTSLEVYDLVGMIANCVVVGGVRRSATLSLSNPSDLRMRDAKQGQFWIENPQRSLSNNSVAFTEKPDIAHFMDEWLSLVKSGSGERGIVNREALELQTMQNERRNSRHEFGVNPCGEIILRPKQFCNLTEVVVRPGDTYYDLIRKVKYATILGTLQSTLSDFNFLDETWKKNTEEERLLGVSLTGLADHEDLGSISSRSMNLLAMMREQAVHIARIWSEALGINMPAAITCVKPSGTVSQLVNASSGLHLRYSPYYIRRVRVNATDPLAKFLMGAKVPCNPEVGQTWENCSTVVFDFPIASPQGSIYRDQRSAIEQLEYWKMLKVCWCEHNPSVTIYVKEDEWLEVAAWVYKHWDLASGITFLPFDGGVYQLAPYEEIYKDQYEEMMKNFPKLDFSKLSRFEKYDQTFGSQEYACSGGACEV